MATRALCLRLLGGLWTGALLGACQIDLWPLAWVALVPLSLAAHGAGPRVGALVGLAAGLVAGSALYGLSPYGGVLYGVLVVYCGVHMAGFGLGVAWLSPRVAGWARVLLPALLWTGFEYLRRYGAISFPITLAGTHAHLPWLCRAASWGGVHAVSFLIALPSGLALQAWASRRLPRTAAAAVVAALLLAVAWGLAPSPAPTGPSLRVAGVQSAYPNWVYRVSPVSAAHRDLLWEGLTRRTREALAEAPDLVVWPETAVHWPLLGDRPRLSELEALVRETGATLLLGTPRDAPDGRRFNSVVALSPGRSEPAVQDKLRPAGYAEWHVSPGERRGLLDTAVGRIGVLVCLESVYPQDARELADQGAELIVVVTDDSGFALSPIPEFHARRSAFRALETGRFVVHLSQAGPSYVFDPRGRRVASLGLFEPGLLRAEVRRTPAEVRTGYQLAGDAFSWSVWALLVGLCAAAALRARRRANANSAA